jgi:hypothetical protein
MGRNYRTHGEKRGGHWILVGDPEGTKPLTVVVV